MVIWAAEIDALFRARHALGVDDCRGRNRLPPRRLAALHVKRVMHPLQRAVVGPSDEAPVDRAPGRQTLWNGAPLTAGARDAHHPAGHLPDFDRALVAARLGRRNRGATSSHSASVGTLSWRGWQRSWRNRFFRVHIPRPPTHERAIKS